MMFIFAQTRTY